MIKGKIFLFTALMIGFGLQANGQSTHLTAKSMALGSGGVAYVEGYHANFINPANLMLGSGSPRVTLGLIGGISSSAGGTLANIHIYNNYFTKGLTISGAVADEALTKWFGTDAAEMKELRMRTEFIPIGLSFRSNSWAVGLTMRSRTLIRTAANKGFAQIGLLGLDSEVFANGQPVNFTLETFSFYEVSAGLSVKLLEIDNMGLAKNVKIYAGAAPKLLLGANTFKFDFNSVLTLKESDAKGLDEIRHNFDYRLEATGDIGAQLNEYYQEREEQSQSPEFDDYLDPAPEDFYGIKARGLGLDLGVTMEMDIQLPLIGGLFNGDEHLQVGLSLTDLGSLSFSEKAAVFAADEELVWKGFDFDSEEIDNKYNGDRDEYISHVLEDSLMTGIYGSYAPVDKGGITRSLPTMLHLGGHLILGKWSVSAELAKSVKEREVVGDFVLSTGLEYDLFGFFPLRVGMRTGGYSSTSYSAGAGLEFRNFEFSLAASVVPNSREKGTHIGAAWSGLVIKF